MGEAFEIGVFTPYVKELNLLSEFLFCHHEAVQREMQIKLPWTPFYNIARISTCKLPHRSTPTTL